MEKNSDLRERSIATIRFLAADMVQRANSGHPGLPLGCAAIAYTIWTKHLKHNPSNPDWSDRDRFILSGGHGSALLYSLLYLTGYDLSLDELKNFRQWGSKTPGHPEYGLTPGVEVTTGPLGQGFANGIGMAIVESQLAAEYNTDYIKVIDHFVYAIVTDGDLMEGVTSEAASIAGHLQLGKLVYLYDDNRITIDGSTDIAFTEDRAARFSSYGWQVLHVKNGNDVDEIDKAIDEAKKDPRPSLIICRTTIGFGLPNKQGTSKAHGEPPGEEELNTAKKNVDWPIEENFHIPSDVLTFFRKAVTNGQANESAWEKKMSELLSVAPAKYGELTRRLSGSLPAGWQNELPIFPADEKGMATRIASGKAINAIAIKVPELIGGSADLAPSTKTWIENNKPFEHDTPTGRNFHFGVREHAMGAIVNGMAVHKGVIPFGATFLAFADYMREPLRLSALSGYGSIWVYTHDSIGVGEDGPTHQPVEHLATLRAIPNMRVIRPADANETVEAWKVAVETRNAPTALIFTRQNVPTLDREIFSSSSGLRKGAYILADLGDGDPEIILMASGSEVGLIVSAGILLAAESIRVRLVSFPSWDLFAAQDKDYKEIVFPERINAKLAVEAGISMGWERWVGEKGQTIAIDRYGASAPSDVLFKEFGFSVRNIYRKAMEVLQQNR